MSTSALILSADFPYAVAAGHAENFQIYVLVDMRSFLVIDTWGKQRNEGMP